MALLQEHGFSEIGVTLQYMPEAIRDHFGNGAEYGVNLHYFVEDAPLGTAGSVKNALVFDETLWSLAGRLMTWNCPELWNFIKHGAIATLVRTRVDCPLNTAW